MGDMISWPQHLVDKYLTAPFVNGTFYNMSVHSSPFSRFGHASGGSFGLSTQGQHNIENSWYESNVGQMTPNLMPTHGSSAYTYYGSGPPLQFTRGYSEDFPKLLAFTDESTQFDPFYSSRLSLSRAGACGGDAEAWYTIESSWSLIPFVVPAVPFAHSHVIEHNPPIRKWELVEKNGADPISYSPLTRKFKILAELQYGTFIGADYGVYDPLIFHFGSKRLTGIGGDKYRCFGVLNRWSWSGPEQSPPAGTPWWAILSIDLVELNVNTLVTVHQVPASPPDTPHFNNRLLDVDGDRTSLWGISAYYPDGHRLHRIDVDTLLDIESVPLEVAPFHYPISVAGDSSCIYVGLTKLEEPFYYVVQEYSPSDLSLIRSFNVRWESPCVGGGMRGRNASVHPGYT